MNTIKACPNCNNIILNKNNTYCSSKCYATYTQRNGGNHKWSEEGKKKLSEWAKKYAYRRPVELKIPNRICLFCKINFYDFPSCHHKYCSKKCYLSNIKTGICKGISGGYRKGAGRGKHGWYKEYYCDSSWELAWVIYQLEHSIPFKRNTEKFPYTFNGKSYSYVPDFILSNGEYVEIKGWPNEKTKSKISQFPHTLNVLWKSDMEDIIDYVKQTYGKDFIKLYEGNPYNQRNNKCKVCNKPAKKVYCSRSCAGTDRANEKWRRRGELNPPCLLIENQSC